MRRPYTPKDEAQTDFTLVSVAETLSLHWVLNNAGIEATYFCKEEGDTEILVEARVGDDLIYINSFKVLNDLPPGYKPLESITALLEDRSTKLDDILGESEAFVMAHFAAFTNLVEKTPERVTDMYKELMLDDVKMVITSIDALEWLEREENLTKVSASTTVQSDSSMFAETYG
jgi:hypothetical protein